MTTDPQQPAPPAPDIYPVTLDGGTRCCALWDGERWQLWTDAFDPPQWDYVEYLNTRVVEWRMP